MASQWQLMWWKLKRHRLAIIFGVVLLAMYGSTLISEVLAPYNLHSKPFPAISTRHAAVYSPVRPWRFRRALRLWLDL